MKHFQFSLSNFKELLSSKKQRLYLEGEIKNSTEIPFLYLDEYIKTNNSIQLFTLARNNELTKVTAMKYYVRSYLVIFL